MPEPPIDTRQESMKYHVGASSFEGDPIHFTANGGAPSRHGGSPSRNTSDSDDSGSGKAVVLDGDADLSGVTGKELMNVASPSCSSSSAVADTHDMCNNLASGSSSEHDGAEDTADEDTMDEDTMDEDTTDEDTAVVSEVLLMPMRSPAMNESDPWRNQEPRLFEDTPEQANISSGLGIHECVRLMGLPEEPQHDADPREVVPEPEEMPPTSILTFQVPGFSMNLAGGIVPFAELQSVEDPDNVGLENLGIFINP